jgi:hypothetical protein
VAGLAKGEGVTAVVWGNYVEELVGAQALVLRARIRVRLAGDEGVFGGLLEGRCKGLRCIKRSRIE